MNILNPVSVFWSTIFELQGRNSYLFFCTVLSVALIIWLYKVSAQRTKEAKEKIVMDLSTKVKCECQSNS